MERHRFGLDSYDRLFPNQDTMPKGGFGNLIALPLQQDARLRDNSLFINNNFEPHPDQWDLLSSIRKLIIGEVQALVRELAETSGIIGVRKRENDDDEKSGRYHLQKPDPRHLSWALCLRRSA